MAGWLTDSVSEWVKKNPKGAKKKNLYGEFLCECYYSHYWFNRGWISSDSLCLWPWKWILFHVCVVLVFILHRMSDGYVSISCVWVDCKIPWGGRNKVPHFVVVICRERQRGVRRWILKGLLFAHGWILCAPVYMGIVLVMQKQISGRTRKTRESTERGALRESIHIGWPGMRRVLDEWVSNEQGRHCSRGQGHIIIPVRDLFQSLRMCWEFVWLVLDGVECRFVCSICCK